MVLKAGAPTGKAAGSREDNLRHMLEHAAHFLPSQGPITAFVHHNTLHAFEDRPFLQAVVDGADFLGTEPYLPEYRYRLKFSRGRIRADDIRGVVLRELGERAADRVGPAGTRLDLWMSRMLHPSQVGTVEELLWTIEETDALRHFIPAVAPGQKDQQLESLRHWILRDVRNGRDGDLLTGVLQKLPSHLRLESVDRWDESRWEEFYLTLLWQLCVAGVELASLPSTGKSGHTRLIRLVEAVRRDYGVDCDEMVHEVLIPFTSAFIDQDFARMGLPGRKLGFLRAFAGLHCNSSRWDRPWMSEARRQIREAVANSLSPWDIIDRCLEDFGVQPEEEETFIAQTLLSLRGFCGMIWQMETRGDRIAKPVPDGTLGEFLAVRLVLERSAIQWACRRFLKSGRSLTDIRGRADDRGGAHNPGIEERAYQLFQISQVLEWDPESLSAYHDSDWRRLLSEVEAIDGLTRRRIFHLAFETAYRQRALSAIYSHNSDHHSALTAFQPSDPPSFQIVCCIDDREESFRRAMEETDPDCETFGAAGFFAVAMNFRGAADAHFTPLCPVNIKPRHNVSEKAIYSKRQDESERRNRRRTIGTVTHRVHIGSRTFAGGWITALLGSLASIPLIFRIVFPRLTSRFMKLLGGTVRPPEATTLELKCEQKSDTPDAVQFGYCLDEMADIVQRLLVDIGLQSGFSRIVVICGHGSSSLNNPHGAAYDCGACGGGKGGPNARAYARMANDPAVRRMLYGRGMVIPDDTTFVGAYHNTCDDSVAFYDLDLLPESSTAHFEIVRSVLERARMLNAHERCRRFESAPLGFDAEDALRHVEARSEDLSQARPECGHATNALCFVGRRSWSRGLFLDRRAFLQSYDPKQDTDDCAILTRILQAVIPVCGGINLEYFFSYVDPTGYGCGTKLPHNITSLLGVMNGAQSDLRTGLPWQMVEIHEPVRLLFVIETTPEKMTAILDRNPPLATLVRGSWVQVATWDPEERMIHYFEDGRFAKQEVLGTPIRTAGSSMAWYRGWREHLEFATIVPESALTGRTV